MFKPVVKLSEYLPPLVFGTATFNYQFNVDPYALKPTEIVERALAQGVRAFDTSPYYGPAEEILGEALATDSVRSLYPRNQYYILTKVGRISGDCFDYSPAWVRHSVRRSCQRLRTNYLDVVYCHDVEFVSPQEVLFAVQELRRIRDEEGLLKHVGICGYPVKVLCELAEMILRETGEPIDIVQSYANFTVQNTRLLSEGLQRFVDAGVDIVANASPLGMGLLRRQGVPVGAMGNWHPAPDGLREVCADMSRWLETQDEKLEIVAVRYALENWLRFGSAVGTFGRPVGAQGFSYESSDADRTSKLGVCVMGVSKIEELDETMRVWRSVLDGITYEDDGGPGTVTPSDAITDHARATRRRNNVTVLVQRAQRALGPWFDFAWASPEKCFVNKGNPALLDLAQGNFTSNSAAVQEATGQLTPPPESA